MSGPEEEPSLYLPPTHHEAEPCSVLASYLFEVFLQGSCLSLSCQQPLLTCCLPLLLIHSLQAQEGTGFLEFPACNIYNRCFATQGSITKSTTGVSCTACLPTAARLNIHSQHTSKAIHLLGIWYGQLRLQAFAWCC